ncbi:MAG: glycosyltransferase family 2 protein, partial [Planctomycetes bacterium]|nr:glycosyltransferase family 2 protein [Planctomycetota bacterium]
MTYDEPSDQIVAVAPTRAAAALSIVIVNWNTKDLLLELLDELLPWDQEVECEILLVDNASSDGSIEAVRARYTGEDSEMLRILEQSSNLGFAGGVNRGFEAARGEWVLLLNTDVRCTRSDIVALCGYGRRWPEAGIIGPDVRNEDGTPQDSYWRYPTLWRLFCSTTWLYKAFPSVPFFNGERYGGKRFTEATEVDAVSGCVFLVRRAVLEDCERRDGTFGLDEGYFMYFEETDLCRRAHDAGWRVRFAPVAPFVHFLGGSSRLARKRNFLEFRRSLVRYHGKHGGPVHALTARALVALSLTLRLPIWAFRGLRPGSRGKEARTMLSLHLAGIADMT